MCLHDTVINSAPRIGGGIEKIEFYRQCSPRRVKETEIKELGKCKCVSSVMTIAPVLNIVRETMDTLGIFLNIDDSVFVFICTIYTEVLKHFTQHAFVSDSNFSAKYKIK